MHSCNKQMIMLTICNYGRTPFQVINFLYRMITAKNIFNCQNQSKPYTGHRLVDQIYIKSYASLKSVLQFQTHAQIYVTCIFLYIYTSIYRVTPLYNILYSLVRSTSTDPPLTPTDHQWSQDTQVQHELMKGIDHLFNRFKCTM